MNDTGEGHFEWAPYSFHFKTHNMPVLKINSFDLAIMTSNPGDAVKVIRMLSEVTSINFQIVRLPAKLELSESDISHVTTDQFGTSFTLEVGDLEFSRVNMFVNGVTTFSITNSPDIVNKIINIFLGAVDMWKNRTRLTNA